MQLLLKKNPLFLVMLLFSLTVQSQTATQESPMALELSEVKPEKAGFSAARLERISSLLEDAVKSDYLPGAIMMVGRKGQIPYFETFGYRDAEASDAMKATDIFRMASMTKPIVSVGIMTLYEEGHFLLDDPIGKFAPEFSEMTVIDTYNEADGSYTTKPAEKQITFRHLLTHTSGIGYPFIHKAIGAIANKKGMVQGGTRKDIALKDNMKLLSEIPLLHEPGEKWTYGLSTDLLGYMIEVLSGQPLDEFLTQRIFEPLGMKDTHFYMDEAKSDRLVKLYFHNKKAAFQKNPDPNANFSFSGAKRYFSGGAGLVSTAMDYAQFLQMLLGKGVYNGKRILGRKTVEFMTTDHLHGTPGRETFGLGFAITTAKGATNRLSSMGNYRWGGIYGTDFWVDPEEGLFGIILTQVLPFHEKSAFFGKLQVAVYQALID